jgi:hypothetical protein
MYVKFCKFILIKLLLPHFNSIICFILCENRRRHIARLPLHIVKAAALVKYEQDDRYSISNLHVLFIYGPCNEAV